MQKIISLLMVILASCSTASEFPLTKEHKEFFLLPTAQQIVKFDSLAVDEKYQLLIVGSQQVHPPALYLVREFAKGGRTVVPFLSQKLEATHSDATIRDIIYVLSEINRGGAYRLREDQRLMALVSSKAGEMHGLSKDSVLRMIEEIK